MNNDDFAKLIYKKYENRLKNFIRSRVIDSIAQEEIFQDTLISAYNSLPIYSGKSSFFSWLCGIAKHEISDYFRKKKIKTILFSHLPFLEQLADSALGPEEELVKAELVKKIKNVFANLSEGYRQLLRLKYIEGFSVVQISERLGVSPKAVESKLTRARLAFREAWNIDNDQLLISNDKSISNKQIKKGNFF